MFRHSSPPGSCCPRRLATRGKRAVRRSGFTLVEAIATIAVLAVVMTAASRVVFAAMDGYVSATAGSRLVSDLSAAMEIATSQLRTIPPSSDGDRSPDLTGISTNSVSWGTSGQLQLAGSVVELVTDEPGAQARPICVGVTSLSIRALDANGNTLPLPLNGTSAQQTRQIEVSMTAQRSGLSRTLRSRVFVRCVIGG